jgi:uncharacterized delta-60 repeat protein
MKRDSKKVTIAFFSLAKYMRKLLVLALIIFFLNLPALRPVNASVSDLDLSFGDGGRVVDSSNPRIGVSSVAVQADGKIVVAGTGTSMDSSYARFGLARYNVNGSPDTSFGSAGKVLTSFAGGGGAQAYALTIQPDGKILAGGYGSAGFALARYNSDGTLDRSFGPGGLVETHIAGVDEQINAIKVQSDGKIVVAGYCDTPTGSWDFTLARYNPDGSLDPGFGSNGIVITNFTNVGRSSDEAYAMVLQNDGKIVVAGLSFGFTRTSEEFALVRYEANGNLDLSFGNNGKVTTDFFGRDDVVLALVIQPDGKIVAAGRAGLDVFFYSPVLARYDTNGNLDASFGTGGKVSANFNRTVQRATGIALQNNGKIVVVGTAVYSDPFSGDFALTRFNSNGSIDTSFGVNGLLTTDFYGNSDGAFDLAIQADGKLVAAGNSWEGSIAIARYQAEFDICLQDDSNGDQFQMNSNTGDYQFTNCSGFLVSGTGDITRRGSSVTLQHNEDDRRLMAKIDTTTNKGSASVQMFSPITTFSITDRNITNNTCGCR